jgi:hypothetical protein
MKNLGPVPGETIVTKRKIKMREFVQALSLYRTAGLNRERSAFPIYETDVVFGLYQWMLKSCSKQPLMQAGHLTIDRYGHYPPPFRGDWRRSMNERLGRGLFSSGNCAEWRRAVGLDPPRDIWIHGLFHDSLPWRLDDELDALFGLVGRQTRASFNRSHPDARWVQMVELYPDVDRWWTVLWYGIEGSVWDHDYRKLDAVRLSISQRPSESLLTFVERARRIMDERWLLAPASSRCSSGPTCTRDPSWEMDARPADPTVF